MNRTGCRYCVWYRVQESAALPRGIVDDLLADVARHTGVIGQLYVRRDDPRTWMEVYDVQADHDAFERALEAAAQRTGADALAEDVRHVEAFLVPP